MEPSNLNSIPPDENDLLEAWLAGNSPTPLPDDGFSQRVLLALPVARPRVTRRQLFCLVGALIGTTFAFLQMLTTRGVLDVQLSINHSELAGLASQFSLAAIGLATVATLASLLFVFHRNLPSLSRLGLLR